MLRAQPPSPRNADRHVAVPRSAASCSARTPPQRHRPARRHVLATPRARPGRQPPCRPRRVRRHASSPAFRPAPPSCRPAPTVVSLLRCISEPAGGTLLKSRLRRGHAFVPPQRRENSPQFAKPPPRRHRHALRGPISQVGGRRGGFLIGSVGCPVVASRFFDAGRATCPERVGVRWGRSALAQAAPSLARPWSLSPRKPYASPRPRFEGAPPSTRPRGETLDGGAVAGSGGKRSSSRRRIVERGVGATGRASRWALRLCDRWA